MGVQLARGFPPRSKWTYREVFHPAVVPPLPFIKLFLVQFILMGKCVCVTVVQTSAFRVSGSRAQVFGSQFSLNVRSQSLGFWVIEFLGPGIFDGKFLGLRLFQVGFNGPRLLLNVHSQSLGSGSQDFQVLGFSGLGKFLVLRFLGVKV